jgi:hypothetical protein
VNKEIFIEKQEPVEKVEILINNDNREKKKILFYGDDIQISIVARSFYDWYINLRAKQDTLIDLNISKGKNNNCTLKNFDNYLNSLKSIGTLTENFIDFECQRLLSCKQYLESLSWCFCDTSTYYEITDDTPCGNTFNYWLYNTQEIINDFEIVEFNKTDSSAYVVIAFYLAINKEIYIQYFEAEEYLIKKKDYWFIDKIVTRGIE